MTDNEPSSNIISTIGYHGTYAKHEQSILENNFYESTDHKMWFGDGVYMFVNGLTNPAVAAKEYMEDTKRRDKVTEDVIVLEAVIRVNNDSFLDLTQDIGLQFFNSYRSEILEKIEEIGGRPTSGFKDYHVLQSLRKELGIEFVKGHVYIKFGIQRSKDLFPSNIPNVTIFVITNPEKNIDKDTIKRVA